MNCAETRSELVSFVKGELTPADERKMGLHLSGCEACRSEERSIRGLLEAVRELTEIDPSEGFAGRVMSAVRLENAKERKSARVARPESLLWSFLGQRVRKAPFFMAALAAHAAAILALACVFLPSRFVSRTPPVFDSSIKGQDPGSAFDEDPGGEFTPADVSAPPELPGELVPPFNVPSPGEEASDLLPRGRKPRHPAPRWIDPRDFAHPMGLKPLRAEVLGWYGARMDEAGKNKALSDTGTGQGREIVSKGLKWLASVQAADGSFEPGSGQPHFRTALTGLALLAFMGDGSTTGEGPFCGHVTRGVAFLLEVQDKTTGRLGPDRGNYMYNHGIALNALCEAYGLSLMKKPASRQRMDEVVEAVRKGVEYLLVTQCPTGGWGYTELDRQSDTSVSAWPVAALCTALKFKILKPGQEKQAHRSLDAAAKWFRHVTDISGAVGYREPGKYKSGPHSLTAVSLYCHGLFMNTVTPSWPGVYEKQIKMVASAAPSTQGKPDFYYWYYASNGLHHCGAAASRGFLQSLVKTASALQQPDGSFRETSAYGEYGGKVYTTAMAVLALETPYRYGTR